MSLHLWLQCVKELCSLLLDQSLLLPALKLLLESADEDLHAAALEQIAAVAEVCPLGSGLVYVSEK